MLACRTYTLLAFKIVIFEACRLLMLNTHYILILMKPLLTSQLQYVILSFIPLCF